MPLVFANPWMLLALPAAALPLIIHLISRQRARRLPISTLRFLFQTDRKTARKHKLVDLLVLLLRTALLLFLVLALSKPFFQPRRRAGDLAPGETAWAIVLDDSYSMGLVEEGLSVFDQAVAAATAILKTIPEGDEVWVLLSSGRRPESLAAPSYRTAAVIEALRRLEGASHSDATVASAVEQGLKFLEEARHPNRALVVISDFQETAVRDALASLKSPAQMPGRLGVYWLDVGRAGAENTAIQAVAIYQAMPFVGLPMQVRATAVNRGETPAQATASLWIDGGKIESRAVEIAPDAIAEIEFTHVPLEAGNLAGEVRLEGDSLPADNRRYFCWHLTGRVRAVVIHGGEGAGRQWNDVHFLRSALAPVVESPEGGRTRGLHVDYVDLAAAAAMNWADCQVVFVVGVERLPTGLAARIEDFARQGGSVIVFAGSEQSAAQPSAPEDPDVALLGLAAGDVRTETAAGDQALTIGQLDEQHPIFRTLTRTAARNLSVIDFYTYRRVVSAGLGGDARVLASYDNGDPFVIERRLGDGRILVLTTRCHADWSNLPVRPLFLPLLYETMKYCVVSQLGLHRDLAPLASLRYPLPGESEYTRAVVKDPDESMRSYPLEEGSKELIVKRLESPGVYHLYFQAGDEETERIVAVNVNPEEGRIVRMDPDAAARTLEPAHGRVFTNPRVLAGVLRRQRQGVALRAVFLYLAALCFLGEVFLANYLIPREKRVETGRGVVSVG